ncbi:uncharacterized protein EV420DRAFT_1649049 [Desarmillaria tabescens]|uniref:G protein-coupled receptor n=1 Tax=Armillaria tabescens TaxID=1929756 RepID=A0AA39MR31_ARMTA|nr:uncharacterized protein EV420DRAFT_1649049 [Desarmillaria tabescens]KAK0443941.1 hypothetical protein EV420DRAFT_1649049 [Desarmillaria tabescens]
MSAIVLASIMQCWTHALITGTFVTNIKCSLHHDACLSTVESQADCSQGTAHRVRCLYNRRIYFCCHNGSDPFEGHECHPKSWFAQLPGYLKTIPSALGILLLFNVLVIFISFYNALENPRRYQSEVFDSLRRDGARIYLIISFLYVPPLLASLVADIPVFFPIFILVCSVKTNLTSRMHLRIESLSNTTHPGMTCIYQEG